ncbi:MAG: hypothetical protein KatS3mg020_1050 [Fimbriimonadales bacterium]|nr:MAG: hypothetical protein KatS3mg020_1050 [Fimbriimonadales bacterium]
MVVIWQSAATIFWMEYRRYVRTRRFWALTLTTLLVGVCLSACATLMSLYAPQQIDALFGYRYSSVWMLGIWACLPIIVSAPLSARMLRDIYKTRHLPDLYLTELHPLGIVLGRVGAIAALTGLSLLLLTPTALWMCIVVSLPIGQWFAVAFFAWVASMLSAASESYALRGMTTPDESPLLTKTASVGIPFLFTVLPVLLLTAAHILLLLGVGDERLQLLPVWGVAPLTTPFLLDGLTLRETGAWIVVLVVLGSVFGLTLWLATAAAQWREWWSARAYRLMRWGGAALWLILVGVHTAICAQVFADSPRAAERLLLLALCFTTLLNSGVATLAGYFGLPRRADTVRWLVPYPFSGILWQWALQWLTSMTLYLAVGVASSQWVALEKWLLWSLYIWMGGVVLPQAIFSHIWAYLMHAPRPTQSDYFHGYYINTRQARAYYETRSTQTFQGIIILLAILGGLIVIGLVVNLLNNTFIHSRALSALGDGLLRLHPWWGIGQEWRGLGESWRYITYTLGWTVLLVFWWGRLGWQAGKAHTRQFIEWQQRRAAETSDSAQAS